LAILVASDGRVKKKQKEKGRKEKEK